MATKKNSKTEEVVIKYPTPYQDRVIISRKKPARVTPGGIILPDSVLEEEETIGYVVAIGPTVGRPKNAVGVIIGDATDIAPRVGDLVLFGEHAGKEITYEGVDYLVMRESDIMCKL